jgi:hypothetical protein
LIAPGQRAKQIVECRVAFSRLAPQIPGLCQITELLFVNGGAANGVRHFERGYVRQGAVEAHHFRGIRLRVIVASGCFQDVCDMTDDMRDSVTVSQSPLDIERLQLKRKRGVIATLGSSRSIWA